MLVSSCSPAELAIFLPNQPSFRANQVFKALYQNAKSFEDITTLPKELRSSLQQASPLFSSQVSKTLANKESAKLVVELYDGKKVETVLLRDKVGRQTACLSCQVGCAMGCAFCKTGTLGLARNLEAGEIVEQFLYLQHQFGTIDNVVFMGMGEPLNNLNEVLKAVELLGHKDGLNMSIRRFTLSTCGLAKEIRELADRKPEIRLAFSLVTADQTLRETLMPTAKANPLPLIKEALLYYQKQGGRRITFEAALLKDVNSRPADANLMSKFAQGLECSVNLIPWNKVEGLPFKTPSDSEVSNYVHLLEAKGLNVELRYKKADSLQGACGQLGEG